MNKLKTQKNKGFTIVEALVAIFILTVSVASMLGVTASSATSARYANNEITANYLLQEAVDVIRNNRDTIAFQNREVAGYGWGSFLTKYGFPVSTCFSANGCDIKMENFNPYNYTNNDELMLCASTGCDSLRYNDTAGSSTFYSHNTLLGQSSNFSRNIKMEPVNGDSNQIKITVRVDWVNGKLPKSQSLVVYLLNWQK